MDNTTAAHSVSHFKKAGELEAKVEHLTQLLSMVVKQMPSPKPNDPVILMSLSPLPNRSPEDEPTNLAQEEGKEKNGMILEEVKSKIEAFENQIKQIQKTDTGISVLPHRFNYVDRS